MTPRHAKRVWQKRSIKLSLHIRFIRACVPNHSGPFASSYCQKSSTSPSFRFLDKHLQAKEYMYRLALMKFLLAEYIFILYAHNWVMPQNSLHIHIQFNWRCVAHK